MRRPAAYPQGPDIDCLGTLRSQAVHCIKNIFSDGPGATVHVNGDDLPVVVRVRFNPRPDISFVEALETRMSVTPCHSHTVKCLWHLSTVMDSGTVSLMLVRTIHLRHFQLSQTVYSGLQDVRSEPQRSPGKSFAD